MCPNAPNLLFYSVQRYTTLLCQMPNRYVLLSNAKQFYLLSGESSTLME